MIFTLIGADFSKSNIGTLSNWIILRELGAGATYTGPSFVEKNATFSATVTLSEGYEIGSAGITITMGGTALDESYYSIVDNVITFTIASVTGGVVIKVPTLNTTTGEEDVIPNYIFTINPTPTNATVTLSATGYSTVSGTGSKSITVADGTEVNWSVSADGYTTRTGNWTISGGNKTENIALSASGGGGIINYFNPDDPDINETQYMSDKGEMIPGSGTLGWSGYIACSPGETYYAYYNKSGTYTKYPDSMVTFFNSSKERVSGMKDDDYLVPEGAAYFRAPFSITRRYNDFMFIKSPDVPTEFIPYNAG
jgi:hypothetical protein